MAKQKGIIKLQGTIAGLSFVQSKAYGPHVRAARGTHKEAKLNSVLQNNADRAKAVTSSGSAILKQLKTLETGFASGDLWSRMTARMFKAKSMQVMDLLETFEGMELNERYPFAKLFAALPAIEAVIKKKRLILELEFLSHACFPKGEKVTQYLYEISILFLDGKGGCVKDSMETEWIGFDEELPAYEMAFDLPKSARYFLIAAGVKGRSEGKPVESFATRGYCICGWGKIS